MIFIKQIPTSIINLNGLKEYDWNFQVISKDKNKKDQSFFVSHISNDAISIEQVGLDNINISIDVKNILKDEYFEITSINGETKLFTVKPNTFYTEDKDYKFKITKTEITKDGDLKIKIFSKVNKEEIGWKCTYKGEPIKFEITPLKKEKSSFVIIKLISKLLVSQYDTIFEFTQNESNETITLKVRVYRNGSMEIIE